MTEDGEDFSQYKETEPPIVSQKQQRMVTPMQAVDPALNEADADLEPHLRLNVKPGDWENYSKEEGSIRTTISDAALHVCGLRFFNLLNSKTWRLREGAVKAFERFLSDEHLPKKYGGNTSHLFTATLEVVKTVLEDQILQVSIRGLELLKRATGKKICGSDVTIN